MHLTHNEHIRFEFFFKSIPTIQNGLTIFVFDFFSQVDLRHFRGGRLGWVLSNTAEAATFVRLVARARTPLRDNRAAVALLKAADAAHSAKIKKAMAGHVMPNESQMRFPAWVGMGALLLGDRFGRPHACSA